ncbi:MAG TPA: biotin carboxylase [Bacteroidetes bacterium]|nr:biotin carboxylase [Bacteroidota bacterium]
MPSIKRILVANRGEIAVRVIRACKEWGIRSIAVFSEVDRKALHVQLADEAFPLGGNSPQESYLNLDKILRIATDAQADAVHPGYGFLSENPVFAERLEELGIIFVGPTGASIRKMGDKTEARKLATHLGIPTVSGTLDPISDVSTGTESAERIGFPVLLKAAAGGGGKGMRIVKCREEFHTAFGTAKSEAFSAFGDDRIYIEKYIDAPRHIEIQILADTFNNILYLGERECSIQRRHQKIIEESPSVIVDDRFRKELGEAAVALAREAQYVNAGTMEFLVDSTGAYYFLEMNTRLQVEHPVTEAVTGIDLVKEQIRVASGERLVIRQNEIVVRGHAIECRICAEDPANNFFPSTGLLTRYQVPEGKVRVDNGFREGDQLSVYYDSLLAKVIVWGTDRSEAIGSMKRALSEFTVQGVKTTIPFCRFALEHESFIDGNFSTDFVERHFDSTRLTCGDDEEKIAAAVAGALLWTSEHQSQGNSEVIGPRREGRWKGLRFEGHR